MSQDEQVEMETVTLQVPKVMMVFLRAMERQTDMTAKHYLEYSVVDVFAADLVTQATFKPTTKHQIKEYNLAVLNKIHPNIIESYYLEE